MDLYNFVYAFLLAICDYDVLVLLQISSDVGQPNEIAKATWQDVAAGNRHVSHQYPRFLFPISDRNRNIVYCDMLAKDKHRVLAQYCTELHMLHDRVQRIYNFPGLAQFANSWALTMHLQCWALTCAAAEACLSSMAWLFVRRTGSSCWTPMPLLSGEPLVCVACQ